MNNNNYSNNKNHIKNTFKESVINEWTLSNWEARVEQLPEVNAAGLVGITELTGGTINKTFKAITKKGTWVVRFNNDELPGIHRPTEAKVLEAIQPLTIAPKLIANNLKKGYLITEYFEGELWTQDDLNNPEKLMQLAMHLKPLHAIPFESKRTELVFRLVEYIHYFSKMDASLKSAINATVSELNKLGFWKKQSQLLHFDLNPLNIISEGEHIRIIDWEYAGAGHPVIEWCVIQSYAQNDLSKILSQFAAIDYHSKVQELIDLMMEMWDQ